MIEDLSSLAQAGLSGVFIALIAALVYIIYLFLKYMKDQEVRHAKMYKDFQKVIGQLSKNIQKNNRLSEKSYTKSEETLLFFKNLNGSFKKAVKEKTEK